MKKILSIIIYGLLGSTLVLGCGSAGAPGTPAPVSTPTPGATQTRALPTPARPGDAVTWRNLRVVMQQAEITTSFITETGFQREPPPGQKFLWFHVRLNNVGKSEIDLPAPEHFSVLYAASEFKPTYGHRQGYADYTASGSTIFPGKELDAWLRFDIPATASLQDLMFVFLPESSQVGVSPSAPGYPWGGEHPTYVWIYAP